MLVNRTSYGFSDGPDCRVALGRALMFEDAGAKIDD
jgi:hypothetical protein